MFPDARRSPRYNVNKEQNVPAYVLHPSLAWIDHGKYSSRILPPVFEESDRDSNHAGRGKENGDESGKGEVEEFHLAGRVTQAQKSLQ